MMEVSKWYFKSYLPVSYFKITTDKSYDEVMKILDENIEQNLKIRRSLSKQIMPKYFEGIIYENQFKINRFDYDFGDARPIIYGFVSDLKTERIIEIKMRISKYQILIILFVLILSLTFSLLILIASFNNSSFSFYILIPLIFVVPVYSYAMFVFPINCERERSKLIKLFRRNWVDFEYIIVKYWCHIE